MVTPVMAAVVAFETRRRRDVPVTEHTVATLVGGAGLFAGIVAAMALGAQPGAAVGLVGVALASVLLRQHGRRDARPTAPVSAGTDPRRSPGS
jgi:hypothetical protein